MGNRGIKVTTESYIRKCNNIYDNYYSYDKTNYTNLKSHIIVTCPKHGDFSVTAVSHLYNRGCKMCGNNMLTQDEFIEQAKKVHGNKYDYSEVVYFKKKSKVKIICLEHGIFEQQPDKHLSGQGCSKCVGKNKNNNDLINKFKKIHGDRYDYSLVDYKSAKTKIKIICSKHGIFEQNSDSHLHNNGCPNCGFNTSISGDNWLKSLNNENIIKEKILKIENKNYKVDGYDPVENVIYEYFGTFWHGHPDRKDLIGIHPYFKIPYSEVYQKTLNRITTFENNGYKLIYIWGR